MRAPSVSDSAQILAWASPPVLPSGPNRRLIVAVAFICSFAAGIVLVLILERANTSFRSDAELATEAKAPCLGMFAEGSAGPSFETARAIAMAAGLRCSVPTVENLTCYVFGARRRRISGKHCYCSQSGPDGKASIGRRPFGESSTGARIHVRLRGFLMRSNIILSNWPRN